MSNPIVSLNAPDLVIWGTKKAPRVHLPLNFWLRRRRTGGVKYEVERLVAHCRQIGSFDKVVDFLSSEYQRNEVYYSFIRMVGIRRFLVHYQKRQRAKFGL